MKKLLSFFAIILFTVASYAQTVPIALGIAKLVPTFQFGIKGGVNLTSLYTSGTLNSSNQAGYLAGFYAKVGKFIQFQPEMYIAGKNVTLTNDNGESNTVKFTSIDVPLLITKNFAGAMGFGAHVNAGPVISFVVGKNQSLSGAYDKITKFDYNNQDVALQFGGGFDVQGLTIDLRYELGLDKLSKDNYPDTRISMFNLSLGLRVY